MKTAVNEIQETLHQILSEQVPPLQIRTHTETNFEVAGTRETMQGKKKVDGIYFSSVVPKPKDVRLYFFPIYTHTDEFKDLPAELRKCLKGKSCFHIKKLDKNLERDIREMVEKGVAVYKENELI